MVQTGSSPPDPRKAPFDVRTRPPGTGLSRCLLLVLLAVVAATGCRAPGALEDAGAARPVRAHPSPQPLWPDAAAGPAPARPAAVEQQKPAPLPGLALDALTGTDARTPLAADPALGPPERTALAAGCAHCAVRPAQYRDLDGDGRPELLTAVLFDAGPDSPRAVLHVYALRGREVLPVLAVPAAPDFTAETVGADLVVHEPTGPFAETSSTYRWNTDRMVLVDRRIKVLGPGADVSGCLLADACGPLVVLAPTPAPTPVPSAGPAPAAGRTAVPPQDGPARATPVPDGPARDTARPAPTRTR
ncbi:hypothetical protein K353_02400 [Kitasatospora sp. SolWspMP-SS2h]|nr:hypothetical protein K353_02400 [Kitasatospora sp. SolWspMP-SS2h]